MNTTVILLLGQLLLSLLIILIIALFLRDKINQMRSLLDDAVNQRSEIDKLLSKSHGTMTELLNLRNELLDRNISSLIETRVSDHMDVIKDRVRDAFNDEFDTKVNEALQESIKSASLSKENELEFKELEAKYPGQLVRLDDNSLVALQSRIASSTYDWEGKRDKVIDVLSHLIIIPTKSNYGVFIDSKRMHVPCELLDKEFEKDDAGHKFFRWIKIGVIRYNPEKNSWITGHYYISPEIQTPATDVGYYKIINNSSIYYGSNKAMFSSIFGGDLGDVFVDR